MKYMYGTSDSQASVQVLKNKNIILFKLPDKQPGNTQFQVELLKLCKRFSILANTRNLRPCELLIKLQVSMIAYGKRGGLVPKITKSDVFSCYIYSDSKIIGFITLFLLNLYISIQIFLLKLQWPQNLYREQMDIAWLYSLYLHRQLEMNYFQASASEE